MIMGTTLLGKALFQYIGVKLIKARPMTRGQYNFYRGWTIPEGENPMDKGYLVVYPDGYESWSPLEVFEEAYHLTDALTFGMAIEAMKKGKKVARAGWNGKDMFIYLAPETEMAIGGDPHEAPHPELPPNQFEGICGKHINMLTADKTICVGWLASQTDMLVEDWMIVE